MYDLQLRLKELPRDLQKLYTHIMSSIAPEYQQESTRHLLLASLPRSSGRMPLIGHHFVDDMARKEIEDKSELDEESMGQKLYRSRDRISAITKGLLEMYSNYVREQGYYDDYLMSLEEPGAEYIGHMTGRLPGHLMCASSTAALVTLYKIKTTKRNYYEKQITSNH
jgi:hypothetical protein